MSAGTGSEPRSAGDGFTPRAAEAIQHRTAPFLRRSSPMTMPPTDAFAFIIGAMKSGTTTLFSYLSQHPEIAAHPVKEPEFFSRKARPSAVDLARYAAGWGPVPAGRHVMLEASTGYTKRPRFPDAAARIAALEGRKSFLYIVRDPLARIESHIAHNLAAGQIAPEAIRFDKLAHHVAVSSYAYQLDAWAAAFPGTPVHLVDFADLRDDPLPMLRGVCRALDLDPDFPFTPLAAQNVRSQQQAYRLPAPLAARLRRALAPDMRRFGDIHGFDVAQWGF